VSVPQDEARFLAGFVQAEGHFAVLEQNAGQSLACVFSLRLRDDDTELIAWLQEITGLGTIRPIAAARTSAPQSEWRISRRAEVREFCRLLTDHAMYGRKAREFAAWKRAVDAWTAAPVDRPAMRAARRDTLEARRYAEPQGDVDITLLPPEDLRHYLGGLISGDGHFSLSGGQASMALKQRQDELPLLRALCDAVELGNVYESRTEPGHPRATWVVSGTQRCHALASLGGSDPR